MRLALITSMTIFVLFVVGFPLASFADVDAASTLSTERFEELRAAGTSYSGRTQAGLINRAVNQLLRPKEQANWTTIKEILQSGEGDCKAFSLLKYAVLKSIGVRESQMRITIVKIGGRGRHSVLEVEVDGEWLVLDNLTLVLVPLSARTNYQRVSSFRPYQWLTDIHVNQQLRYEGPTVPGAFLEASAVK